MIVPIQGATTAAAKHHLMSYM